MRKRGHLAFLLPVLSVSMVPKFFVWNAYDPAKSKQRPDVLLAEPLPPGKSEHSGRTFHNTTLRPLRHDRINP